MKPSLTYTAVAAAMLLSSTAYASEPVNATFDKGYLVLGTKSNSFSIKLDGRIMYDIGTVSSDENDKANARDNVFVAENNFRRARLALKTKFNDTWAAEFDLDFADGDGVDVRDLWISYVGLENFEFKIGNHKPFFSIAELTTSRWTTFMETPAITDVSAPGRRVGFSASYGNDDVFVGATIFGDDLDVSNSDAEFENEDGDEVEGISEKFSYSARALYRPYVNDDVTRLFHVGVNYLNLVPQSDDPSRERLRQSLESSVLAARPLNTGRINDVEQRISKGVEIAARFDKFALQAEYVKNTIERSDSSEPDVDSDGFYVEASYMIFGSGRNYNLSDGEFGPVFPEHKNGNLEVALRYSTIDLNDLSAGVEGGSADTVSLALNWYAHSNMVIRFNHIITSLDEFADGDGDFNGDDDISISAVRFQFMF